MKTSHSAFAGFPRDEFTTLPETHDRLLATALTATWTYGDTEVEFGAVFRAVRVGAARRVRAATTACRCSTRSTRWAKSCSTTIDIVDSITLEMPNRHHLPIDLTRFGMENRNEIFVATEEPHGLIKATLSR